MAKQNSIIVQNTPIQIITENTNGLYLHNRYGKCKRE